MQNDVAEAFYGRRSDHQLDWCYIRDPTQCIMTGSVKESRGHIQEGVDQFMVAKLDAGFPPASSMQQHMVRGLSCTIC
jgi:hypothetical protein